MVHRSTTLLTTMTFGSAHGLDTSFYRLLWMTFGDMKRLGVRAAFVSNEVKFNT
jgi:hypothetical protein